MLRLVLLVLYLVTLYSLGPVNLDPDGLNALALPKSDQNAGLDPDGRTAQQPSTGETGGGLDPNG